MNKIIKDILIAIGVVIVLMFVLAVTYWKYIIIIILLYLIYKVFIINHLAQGKGFSHGLKEYNKMSSSEKVLIGDPNVMKAVEKFKKSEDAFYKDIDRLKKKYNIKDDDE